MTHPRVVGIDYGTKRVGLAVSDPLRTFAQPHGTYRPSEAVGELERLQREEGLATLVVGWPLEKSGEEGPATARVQQFINRLRNALSEVEIVKWDERYTTIQARENLERAERRGIRPRRRRGGHVDEAAAGLILQEYLDEQARG